MKAGEGLGAVVGVDDLLFVDCEAGHDSPLSLVLMLSWKLVRPLVVRRVRSYCRAGLSGPGVGVY